MKTIDTVAAEITRDRVEYLVRSVMRDWLERPITKMMKRCAATHLARALKEDPILARLAKLKDEHVRGMVPLEVMEREIRDIHAGLGTDPLRTSRA